MMLKNDHDKMGVRGWRKISVDRHTSVNCRASQWRKISIGISGEETRKISVDRHTSVDCRASHWRKISIGISWEETRKKKVVQVIQGYQLLPDTNFWDSCESLNVYVSTSSECSDW